MEASKFFAAPVAWSGKDGKYTTLPPPDAIAQNPEACSISSCVSWQGADLTAGSLIKNPGETIAPCGGYVAGKDHLVESAAARLSAPGLGGVEFGSTPGHVMFALFQGSGAWQQGMTHSIL